MNKKAIKGCSMLVLVYLISIICFHTSSSAKVYRGTFEKNMKWSYDTQSKTIIVKCKGRMADCGDFDSGRNYGWLIGYNKAEKLIFKRGITHIGEEAFDDFFRLKEVVFPEGLVSIGASAFSNTENLKRVKFPSTLKSVGEASFDSSGLSSIHLKNLKKVGSEGFSGTKLTKLTIPYQCKEIRSYAFVGCHKLKKVVIENGISKISSNLFARTGIVSITIPKSVTEIGENAFYAFSPEESKLKSVTIQSTQINKWGKDIFGKARKDLVIKVPKCRLKEYTKALRKGGLPKYVKIVAE